MLWMDRDIENVAFVCHQPSTQKAIGGCGAVFARNRNHQARKGQRKLATESAEAPRGREGELLDFDDSKKVAK